MAKKEESTTLSDEQATGEGADVQIRLTRRPPWQPSPRLPDYLLEDELNRLMDPREWKTYRALWRHSIGLRRTPLITAGYAEICEMTGLSRGLGYPGIERAYEETLCCPHSWAGGEGRDPG